ncbi:MAG TPA: protein translocase subunit SecD [Actinomycetota bacterium]|nr:protein translocase subunit SecD [Actinomycetota bacterium]
MASSPRSRAWRGLLLIAVVIAAMWGVIVWKGYDPHLGLDLQGGVSVVLAPKEGQAVKQGAIEQAVEIIRSRVDALGVAEPEIGQQEDNILVQLPGVRNQEQALGLIGQTAKLTFRPVLEQLPPESANVELGKDDAEKIPECDDPETFADDTEANKEVIYCVRSVNETTNRDLPRSEWPRLRLGPIALEGADVSDASAELPPTSAEWQVNLDLKREGAAKFKEITGQLACNQSGDPKRQLAVVLDRVVETHPQMGEEVQCQQGLSGGSATISGNFSEAEAKGLALVLRYGALPVELEVRTLTTVSPTLGKESLRSGLLAAVLGVGIVFLYVLFFYRALGLIIWLGLLLHGAVTFAIVILLGQTAGFALSLAGIAGLIVSLGIATDSFIVYFERVKDEVLTGKTVRAAVERAWPSARRTIIAADLVTALAAVVLYLLTVGNVRGFALMLGLSTTLDIVISFMFMHPIVFLLARTKILSGSKTLGFSAVGGGAYAAEGARS